MQPRKSFSFDCPTVYKIKVQGWIDPAWSDKLEGMTISTDIRKDDMVITTLEGELMDQAALAGVLNTLYELHLPIHSIKRRKIQILSSTVQEETG